MLQTLIQTVTKVIDVYQDTLLAFLILIIPAFVVSMAAFLYARTLPASKRKTGSIGVGSIFLVLDIIFLLWAYVPEIPLRKDALWVLQRIINFISMDFGFLVFLILILVGITIVLKIATGEKPVDLMRFEDKINELTYINVRLVEEKKELSKDIEVLKKYIAERDDLIKTFKESLGELKENLELKEKDLQRLIQETNERASEIAQYQKIVSTLESKVKQLEIELKIQQDKNNQLLSKNALLRDELERLRSVSTTLSTEFENAIAQIMPLLNSMLSLINKIESSPLNDESKTILIDLIQNLGRIVGPILNNYEHATITEIEKIEVIGALRVLKEVQNKIIKILENREGVL